NSVLNVTNIQFSQIGLYSVQISNLYGTTTSSNASLTLGVIVPSYSATNQIHASDGSFSSIFREASVYDSAEFPPYPIVISEIRFRPDIDAIGPFSTALSNVQFSLSTTQAKPDQLTSTFSENTGANNTVVYTGPLSVTTSFATIANGTKAFD